MPMSFSRCSRLYATGGEIIYYEHGAVRETVAGTLKAKRDQ